MKMKMNIYIQCILVSQYFPENPTGQAHMTPWSPLATHCPPFLQGVGHEAKRIKK
jgi:hypothetical protein